jgi:hypothetical protein
MLVAGSSTEDRVPVTAKLSQRFYQKLGDDVANELVDWFNAVDATYRADLRELNELNFARFDAKLGQRLAELDVRWERRLAELDARWERRLAELETHWEQRFGGLERRIGTFEAGIDAKLHALRSDVVKWTFVFWATTALAVIGLYLR